MDYPSFAVEGLPEYPHAVNFTMHAGEVSVTERGSALFFWDFTLPSTSTDDKKRPLVIWLNGGPGCSSLDGALMEIGPIRPTKDGVQYNQGWLDQADLLFIDQPMDTGFSSFKEDAWDTTLTQSTGHLMTFLERYFDMIHKEGIEYDDIIIAGESYAGQYIPHLARSIKDSDWGRDKLKAVSLGNAWIDPNLQALSYIPFGIHEGFIVPSRDESRLESMLQKQDVCQNVNNSNKAVKFADENCDNILSLLLFHFKPDKEHLKCINVYDISKVDDYPACGNNWPENLGDVTAYLNKPDVQQSLNIVTKNKWKECNDKVFNSFKPSRDELSAPLLAGLLDDGVKVQLFSGVNDLICNYLSTEMVMRHHLRDFITLPEEDDTLEPRDIQVMKTQYLWEHSNVMAGEASVWGNLSYVKINDASHMVAYDFPERSQGLLEILMNDKDYVVNGTIYTGSKPPRDLEAENKDSSENEENTGEKPLVNRYVALVVLILVFALLGGYLIKSILG